MIGQLITIGLTFIDAQIIVFTGQCWQNMI